MKKLTFSAVLANIFGKLKHFIGNDKAAIIISLLKYLKRQITFS